MSTSLLYHAFGVRDYSYVKTESVDAEVLSLLNLDEADIETIAETLPNAVEEAQQLLSDGGA